MSKQPPQGLFSEEELLSIFADFLTWTEEKRRSLEAQLERLARKAKKEGETVAEAAPAETIVVIGADESALDEPAPEEEPPAAPEEEAPAPPETEAEEEDDPWL